MKIDKGDKTMLFNERLVELRKQEKNTQAKTAKNLGLTRSAYSQYELGTRNPDQDTLKKMADYFDVTIDYLLGRNEKESGYTLPEDIMLKVMKEAEAIHGVSLRDDPVVESAVRDLLNNLAMMKKANRNKD